jgi:hypothetical protein
VAYSITPRPQACLRRARAEPASGRLLGRRVIILDLGPAGSSTTANPRMIAGSTAAKATQDATHAAESLSQIAISLDFKAARPALQPLA